MKGHERHQMVVELPAVVQYEATWNHDGQITYSCHISVVSVDPWATVIVRCLTCDTIIDSIIDPVLSAQPTERME